METTETGEGLVGIKEIIGSLVRPADLTRLVKGFAEQVKSFLADHKLATHRQQEKYFEEEKDMLEKIFIRREQDLTDQIRNERMRFQTEMGGQRGSLNRPIAPVLQPDTECGPNPVKENVLLNIPSALRTSKTLRSRR